jgi:hypothetical protein
MRVTPSRMAIASAAAGILLAGCSYVKTMPSTLRKEVAGRDTIYVMPGKSRYETQGIFFSSEDSARAQEVRDAADDILPEEIRRVFPSAVVIPVPKGGEDSVLDLAGNATVIGCEVVGFTRSPEMEAIAQVAGVLFMIPTFGLNLGFPFETSSEVYLKVKRPGASKVIRLKHRDQVNAYDREDLRFQIRVMLDPDYRA